MKNIKSILKSIGVSLSLSWKSSNFHTVIRIFGSILPNLTSLLGAFLMKQFLDALTTNNALTAYLPVVTYVVLMALIRCITFVVQKMTGYSIKLHDQVMENYVHTTIMNHAMEMDMAKFDDPEYYDNLKKTANDSHVISQVLWDIISGIGALISTILAFVVLARENILFGVLILAAAIPSAIAQQRYVKQMYHLEVAQMNEMRKKYYVFGLSTEKEYAHDIRSYNLKDILHTKYSNAFSFLFGKQKKLIKKQTIISTFVELLPEAVLLVVSIFILKRILLQQATIGDFTYIESLSLQLSSGVFMLIYSLMSVYDNQLKINNINSFLLRKPATIKSGNSTLSEIETIEFKNVSFKYENTEKAVFHSLNLLIEKNEKILLVGVNGAGKTTLIKLLLRLYIPNSGVILVNGKNINEYDIIEYRKVFSSYFQNSRNYAFTLRENIALGDWGNKNNDEKIKDVIHDVNAVDIFKKGINGIDTYINKLFSETGLELSGGESQKIALARTIFRKAQVYILDEPSSSLDPETEAAFFNQFEEICKDKTTILTSHRLSNSQMADKVAVIEDGKVIEFGHYQDLLSQKGRFYQLFHYQADRYLNC